MRLIIMMVAFLTMSFSAVMADSLITVDPSKLTADQLKQVQSIVGTPDTSASTLSNYAQVGKDIGLGIAEAAKQLGMAAAEFANTPAGMIAIGVIVWKVILSGMFTSIALFSLGVVWSGVAYSQYKRMIADKVDINSDGGWFLGISICFVVSIIPALFFIGMAVSR